jgi:hypothetical protein
VVKPEPARFNRATHTSHSDESPQVRVRLTGAGSRDSRTMEPESHIPDGTDFCRPSRAAPDLRALGRAPRTEAQPTAPRPRRDDPHHRAVNGARRTPGRLQPASPATSLGDFRATGPTLPIARIRPTRGAQPRRTRRPITPNKPLNHAKLRAQDGGGGIRTHE